MATWRPAARGLAVLMLVVLSGCVRGQNRDLNWPQFRGTQAQGVAEASSTREKWKRFKWKTPLPGLGLSSPVIWSNKVFITTAVSQNAEQQLKIGLYGDIESADEPVPHSWQIFCIAKDTGTVFITKTF